MCADSEKSAKFLYCKAITSNNNKYTNILCTSSLVPSEPPDIRNWFSSYIYESLPLDTACDFATPDEEETEVGKLYVGEKSGSGNRKDSMASINVEKIGLCTQMNTSDAMVNGPNTVEDTKLDHQYVCKVCFFLHLSLLCQLVVYVYSTSNIKLYFLLQGAVEK